ncbi:MAG: tripartite tricarboxylate transporter substrate binding protein [Burkholderiales bacterium]
MKARLISQGICRVIFGHLMALVCNFAFAQTAYPTRPITMIVPFPPAGVADIVARPIAQAMGRDLGQTVVIENKAGAGGGIGMAQAARAEPNGYTILMALSSIVVVPEADKVLNRPEMYQLRQLKAIARFTADPTILVVKADSPWKTYAQFMEYVRANPAKVSFGSSGNYGSMHIPMEQLKVATGAAMLHVPYTGAGPAVTALLAGQVDALSTGPSSVVQQIQAGKLRALAHWGTGRLAILSDVPSLTELGVPITYAQWAGLFVPAQVPQPIVDRLRAAARFAATDPATVRSLTAAGTEIQYLDGADFDQYVKTESADMQRLVQIIGKVE